MQYSFLSFITLVAAGSIRYTNGKPPPPERGLPPSSRPPPRIPRNGIEQSPKVQASVHAKGAAVVHVTNPNDFRDAYVQQGTGVHLKIDHDHTVTASGVATGNPPENGAQAVLNHPLRAKASGRAVMGYVRAPEGGRGNIRIKSSKGVEDHHVAGGTSETKTGFSEGVRKAKVITTVTRGGDLKVIAGPNEESLPDDPRVG